jgi:2-haloacid dehalogenase
MNNTREAIFDLYGTLVDVHTVAARGNELFSGRGEELSRLWRQKQLEYTWLLTLMERYEPFEAVTQRALTFSLRQLGLELGEADRAQLGQEYLKLNAYPETLESLTSMRRAGIRLTVLSNGSERSIDAVLHHSGLRDALDQVLSVERVQRFKPHSAAYGMAAVNSEVPMPSKLFVSSNAWDASGAGNFGFQTCWINRSGQPFEELGQTPTLMVKSISDLVDTMLKQQTS